MRRIPLYSAVSLLATLTLCVTPALAQRTATKEIGGGRKIVLHYNGADQVVESDTFGPNGELLEKDLVQYRPNAYSPNTLNTSYWPNGKNHKVAQNTYDDNSNFTGEFIQVFDESGKQIGGHRLTHDPVTNIYHCADWDVAAQSYKPRACPAGEESEGTPETAKTYTQQDVEQQLQAARKATPAPATAATAANEVALVLPSHVRPGERVSGTLVSNPADYENNPQLIVTRFQLPEAPKTLEGWKIEMSGEPPQSAAGPIKLTIPPGQVELAVALRAPGATQLISKAIAIPRAARGKNQAMGWLAPAVCVQGRVCMVHGEFSGESDKTFAAFSDQPAQIVAETTTAVYLTIPDGIPPGQRPLAVAQGDKAIVFPVVVSKVSLIPPRRTLSAGEKSPVTLHLEGPEEVPDPEWRPGNFPPSNLDEARKLVPGYKLAHADKDKEEHEAEEKREKAEHKSAGAPTEKDEDLGGEILLVARCTSADGATFRGSNNGTYVFRLHSNGFQAGDFKYTFVVESAKAGSFSVETFLLPMLAPIKGQEFTVSSVNAGVGRQ